jgi:hypothetical protein
MPMFMVSMVATKKQIFWHKLVLSIGKRADKKEKENSALKGKGKIFPVLDMEAYEGGKLEHHSCLTLSVSIMPWLVYMREHTPSNNCKAGCMGPSG